MITPLLLVVALASQPPTAPSKSPTTKRAQQQQKATHNEGAPQPSPNVTVTLPPRDAQEIENERKDRERQIAIQQEIGTFTGLLVLVGAIQVITAGFASFFTARAANAAKRSAQAASDNVAELRAQIAKMDQIAASQTSDMKASIAEATRAATAMEQTARATATNVELVRESIVALNKQAASLKKAARLTEKSLVLLERPFVVLKTINFGRRLDPDRPQRYIYDFEPILHNVGPLPTKNFTLIDNWALVDEPIPKGFGFEYTEAPGPGVVGPRVETAACRIFLSDDALTAIQSGSKHFYIWGKAEYRDWFQSTAQHKTTFCFRLSELIGDPLRPFDDHNPLSPTFVQHDEYNEAD